MLWRSYPDEDEAGSPLDPWVYDEAGLLVSLPGVISNLVYEPGGQTREASYANGVVTRFACFLFIPVVHLGYTSP